MSEKLNYENPPQTIRFEFVGRRKPLLGEYFLREDGAMALWIFKDPAARQHPVYRLVEEK